jgi:anthranilate synthase/aminodeoxychorismate synthase-like glutamine amidotransferase
MLLVIDNYDSFTYNLVQYLGELGAELVVKRNDEITVADIRGLMPDQIVISPGPGRPEDAGVSVETARQYGSSIPILGVCLGHQAIGYAFGASVVPAPTLLHGKSSEVEHDGKGVFKGIASPFLAGRYHSLVIGHDPWPEELEVSARTTGGETIMGLRHAIWPVHGVQFHPESVLTDAGHSLLKNFLEL